MFCSVTGWTYSGHSEDLLWTWSDESLMISSEEGPYTSGILGGHKPTTQPLLADLDLDGDAELVIAALDEISEEPVVLALPLQTNSARHKSKKLGKRRASEHFSRIEHFQKMLSPVVLGL